MAAVPTAAEFRAAREEMRKTAHAVAAPLADEYLANHDVFNIIRVSLVKAFEKLQSTTGKLFHVDLPREEDPAVRERIERKIESNFTGFTVCLVDCPHANASLCLTFYLGN
jgi:hypothetical protein